MKIGERTLHNAAFSAGSSLIPLGLSFVFWPYIVGSLGESAYGIFALVGSIIGYFALLDLGLGNAVVKYVSEYIGRRDMHGVEQVIGVAFSLFLAAGIIGMGLIFLLARALATDLLKIPPELVYHAYLAFCAAGAGFFFTMLMTLFSSIVNGLNRYDISSLTIAVMGAISTLGAVFLLWAGGGLVALVWLNVIVPALVVIYLYIVIVRLLPEVSIRCSLQLKMLKRILRFGMYSVLSRITYVVIRQVAPLLIGAMLGVEAVTYYFIPFTMLSRLTALFGRIGMVTLPAVSELQGQQRQKTIRHFYLTAYRMMISFCIAFMLPLLIFGVRFIALWMGTDFARHSGAVFSVLTVGIFFDLCTNVPSFVSNGLGHPKVAGISAIINAGLFLCLMVGGANVYGIVGVATAYALSQALVAPFFIFYVTCFVVGVSLREMIATVYFRPLLAGVVVAIPLLFVPQIYLDNLYVLLGVMALSVGVYFLIALLFGVYQAHERRVLMDYITRITTRLRVRRAL